MGPGIFRKELRTLVAVLPAKRSKLLEQPVPYTCTAANPALNCFTSSDFKATGPQIPFSSHTCTQQFSWGRAAKLATDVDEGELQS